MGGCAAEHIVHGSALAPPAVVSGKRPSTSCIVAALHSAEQSHALQQCSQLVIATRPRGFDYSTLQSFRNLRVDGMLVPPSILKDLDLLLMPKTGVVSFDFVSFWVCHS